jgi:hypothetical protein
MKLTERNLQILKRLSGNISAKISEEMFKKFEKKGLVRGRVGSVIVTEIGDRELSKRFGDDY